MTGSFIRPLLPGFLQVLPVALFAMIGSPESAASAMIYADSGMRSDCPGSYDPSTRSCGSVSSVAYRTLRGAADVARSGDTVLLRGGTFME